MNKILVLNNARIFTIEKIINNGFLVIKNNLIIKISGERDNNEFKKAQNY